MIRLLLLVFVFPAIAHSDQMVSVSILSLLQPKSIRVTLVSPAIGMLDNSPVLAGKTIDLTASDKSEQHHSLSCTGNCNVRFEIEGKIERVYSGQFNFYYNNTIQIVLFSKAEDLVSSIACSEMRGAKEAEAIKAFAVVSRSFLTERGRHPELQADFCDTTHCQVFQNLEPSDKIRNTVQQTESLVMIYQQRTFAPFYSRSCGGRTASFEQAWGDQSRNYEFHSVSCPCNDAAHTWQTALSFDELEAISGLTSAKLVRNESRILISSKSRKMQFPLEIFRTKLGQTYGWKKLPGNRYNITETSKGYVFRGNGQGHGVGFCQTGAEILASKGLSFTEILSHYFPGSEIKTAQTQRGAL